LPIYQEGLHIPPVLRGGRMEESVLAIYEANCRSPAMLAALETGPSRIGAIAETHGANAARIRERNRLTVGFGDHM
jgi:N-methylhydantoinase B/oxoprolinase/acetone carboxylase alpha subunit